MSATEANARKPQRMSLSQQAQQCLRDLIDAGSYQPGERLPSQADLAVQLGISRLTLREALLSLDQEGIIVLKQGIGTFVSPAYGHRLESGLERLQSILELAADGGRPVTFDDLDVTEEPADKEMARVLRLAEGTPLTRVGRTIRVGSRPVAYMVDVAPTSLLASEEIDSTFDGSILNLLKRKGNLHLAHAVAAISAVNANRELALRLNVKSKQALQLFEETLFNRDGIPVEFSRNYFVPAFFDFRVVRR